MPDVDEYGQRVGDLIEPPWAPCRRPETVHLLVRYVALEPLSVDHTAALHVALCAPGDRPPWPYRPTEPPAGVAGMAGPRQLDHEGRQRTSLSDLPRDMVG